jgi:hypothetical protein
MMATAAINWKKAVLWRYRTPDRVSQDSSRLAYIPIELPWLAG